VTVRGQPIEGANFRNPRDIVNPDISYSQDFGELEACHGAGLDMWQWDQNVYPPGFKARVVAWWRLHKLIQLHSQDAAIKRPKKG